MNNNPIRKMHVGWEHHWPGGIRTAIPRSIREWVGICPKCNAVTRSKSGYQYGSFAKNSRRTAKDALHYHMRTFH